ncbi:hypothetical protein [Actinomadura litoris]|uniref:hypothetical protein n=1 Tax=Actinomadura litoris TaxID=2678616 RepID=UPI001FA6C6E3|nr:hypothetical protein [Actinomadura litoris]
MPSDHQASEPVEDDECAGVPSAGAELVSAEAVGRWFGVPHATVSQWRRRYDDDSENPCPQPDVLIGRWAGWRRDRKAAWLAWDERRKAKQKAKPEEYQADTVTYLGPDKVGEWLGISRVAVTHLRAAYADTATPCPEPDVVITGGKPIPGWLPEREAEWREWNAGRPGRGAPGRKRGPRAAK